MVFPAAELNLAFKFRMSQRFATDSVPHGILDDSLQFALVAFVSASFLLRFLFCYFLETDNAGYETIGEFLGISA
ncbi:hypothetical protein RRF57_000431 [Xylaria bambusicola]|uniref:Uncharacterized protein n=1 Tax=Xylaria bambusicola TaxID=326684 RepID=A0AAN7UCV2_9PEZI